MKKILTLIMILIMAISSLFFEGLKRIRENEAHSKEIM